MPLKAFDLETELPKAITRLRELANDDGLAPMLRDYNKQRGAGCASTTFFESHGVAYSELVRRAGLQQRRRAPDVPPDVEAEIQAAFARGDHHPLHYRDWPLFAIPTKVEQFTVPLPDGSGYRITRYYASIR